MSDIVLCSRDNRPVPYTPHELFKPPESEDAVLWRYVDLSKFVALLNDEALFFARADRLGDTFEGSCSMVNLERRPRMYEGIPEEALRNLSRFRRRLRRYAYINCWNLSEHESAGLWKQYVPPEGGVAIRSTFRRFVESLRDVDADGSPTPSVYVGRVTYVDYSREFIPEDNVMAAFLHKRHQFRYENELRAVVVDIEAASAADESGDEEHQAPPPGVSVAVDIEELIERVHVSPYAPAWFFDLVTSLSERFGLARPVVQSDLGGAPVF